MSFCKQKVDAEFVKRVLRNYVHVSDRHSERMEHLLRGIDAREKLLFSVADGNREGTILGSVREDIRYYQDSLEEVEWEWMVYDRVWNLYQMLEKREYSVLKLLYVEEMKYESAREYIGFSKGAFERARKKGLQIIVDTYAARWEGDATERKGA